MPTRVTVPEARAAEVMGKLAAETASRRAPEGAAGPGSV
jgi:hypothetical protein